MGMPPGGQVLFCASLVKKAMFRGGTSQDSIETNDLLVR